MAAQPYIPVPANTASMETRFRLTVGARQRRLGKGELPGAPYRYTAPQSACLRNTPENAECVRMLWAAGADTTLRDASGRTAHDIARQKKVDLILAALGQEPKVSVSPSGKAAYACSWQPAYRVEPARISGSSGNWNRKSVMSWVPPGPSPSAEKTKDRP